MNAITRTIYLSTQDHETMMEAMRDYAPTAEKRSGDFPERFAHLARMIQADGPPSVGVPDMAIEE